VTVRSLPSFTLADMMDCGAELRRLGAGAESMEEVANRVVRHLYDQLGDATGRQRACALVRCYKTHPFGELDGDLQAFARGAMPDAELTAETRCLTLLATAGDEPAWNSRHASVGHKAIPLPSESVVQGIPMIAQLVRALGLDVSVLVKPDPGLLVDEQEHTFNVFYVPEALGSPYVPAQEGFVVPHGIESALGFGCLLPPADLLAVILFTKVAVPPEVAELFRTLALSVKLAVLPFANRRVFA